jgi:hypothetical protein
MIFFYIGFTEIYFIVVLHCRLGNRYACFHFHHTFTTQSSALETVDVAKVSASLLNTFSKGLLALTDPDTGVVVLYKDDQ